MKRMGSFIDLTNRTFGRLRVLEKAPKNGRFISWVCQCECGVVKTIRGGHLRNKKIVSCGCFYRDHLVKDLTGMVFNRLTVLGRSEKRRNGSVWNCRCSCGKELEVPSRYLKTKNTQSCGCLQKERHRASVKTHGMSDHPLYQSWCAMLQRCENPKAHGYKNYGGRGIEVSEPWHDFVVFLTDMGERPERHTLDRINPNGNYSKENCKWSSHTDQHHNKQKDQKIRDLQYENDKLRERLSELLS